MPTCSLQRGTWAFERRVESFSALPSQGWDRCVDENVEYDVHLMFMGSETERDYESPSMAPVPDA